ncbi:MAG: T9SS type A sorting domain-containing protein [Flavipsychrobacter sp.]|nr:T9SS type A sorting domain-containing protein [Flavipsychrobacter sp.]
MTYKNLIAFFLFVCLISESTAQTYVTQSGSGLMNGSSWNNAIGATQFRNVLATSGSGAEFWVASGIYKPHLSIRDTFFRIPSGVKVYGGFSGNETQLAQRNWETNVTILSGDIGIVNDSSDNSLHVVVFEDVAPSTLIDGFTIRDGVSSFNNAGGGILNHVVNANSRPTIKHCKFLQNTALMGGGVANLAWAPFLAKCTIDSCLFDGNDTYGTTGGLGGGGLYSEARNSFACRAELAVTNCLFQNNISASRGGGVYARSIVGGVMNISMLHCDFSNNYGTQGAGAQMLTDAGGMNILIDGCKFESNISSGTGGGLAIWLSDSAKPKAVVRYCVFDSNVGTIGGALYYVATGATKITKSRLELHHSIFKNNRSVDFGCVSVKASLTYVRDTSNIYNCLFYNNHGGGGRAASFSTEASSHGLGFTRFVNNTVYQDSVHALTSTQGGIVLAYTNATNAPNTKLFCEMDNNIIWWGQNPWPSHVKPLKVGLPPTNMNGLNVSVKKSLLRGSGGSNSWNTNYGTNLGGNIDSYPQFIDTNFLSCNLNLDCSSPCLDAGSNASIFIDSMQLDLDQHSRIAFNTVDMGCFERQVAPPAIPLPYYDTLGLTISLWHLSTGVYDSMYWDFGDGTFSPDSATQHQYGSAGTYEVCLYLSTICGLKKTCFDVVFPGANLFTQTASVAVGSLYPNPSTRWVSISNWTEAMTVRVYGIDGAEVTNVHCDRGSGILDMSAAMPGIYIVVVSENDSQRKSVHKLVLLGQ